MNWTKITVKVAQKLSAVPCQKCLEILCVLLNHTKSTLTVFTQTEFLWQCAKTPQEVKKSKYYLYNKRMSENTLACFMSSLSQHCELSQQYINHSIRVTGATFLARQNFSAKQIVGITGHCSMNTLALYSKVSENEKLMMGMSMNYFLMETPTLETQQHEKKALGCPPRNPEDTRKKSDLKKIAPKCSATESLQEDITPKRVFQEKKTKCLCWKHHSLQTQHQHRKSTSNSTGTKL